MMKLFSLLLVASLALFSHAQTTLDPIAASSHANCLSYPDPSSLYVVQACPIYSGAQTVLPVALTSESTVVFSSVDDSVTSLPLTWPIIVYGNNYSTIAINTNGMIMFGATPGTSLYGSPIPSTSYNSAAPVIAPFAGDEYLLATTNVTSRISTGFVGSSPNQLFVVRYNRITFWNQRTSATPTLLNFDVVFYQNSSNYEVRYYRIDVTGAAAPSISIGTQQSISRYVAVFSATTNITAISAALQGNVLSFVSNGTITPPTPPPATDAIPASSHANCLSYPDASNTYVVQACPIYTGTQTVNPATLTGETAVAFATPDDSFVTRNLTWPVSVYGTTYNSFALNTNGMIMFGASPSTSLYNNPIPSSTYNSAGPVIAAFAGDLLLVSSVSSVTTGFIGSTPNQIFVIRYTRLTTYSQQSASSPSLISWDVYFFQNSSNFQIRYNRIDVPASTVSTPSIAIGSQSNDASRFVAVFSQVSNFANISAALQGNILSFTYNPNATVPSRPSSSSSSSSTGASGGTTPTIDPIPLSSHANCINYPDSQGVYSVQACPIYSGSQTVFPETLTNQTVIVFDSTDDAYTSVALPFTARIYNTQATGVAISTNGLLMFGSAPSTSYAQPIPSSAYASGAGPVIHPFQGDMFLLATSSISTGTLGVAPNRIFVIRYNRFTAYATRLDATPALFSFDVYLFQNSSNFQIRYYRIDTPSSVGAQFSVGIQGVDATRFVAVFSQSTDYANISSALLGNTLSFTTLAGNGTAPAVSSSTGSSGPVSPFDPIAASPHANCISYTDSFSQYAVQACPIYSGTQTVYPSTLSNERVMVFENRDDGLNSTTTAFPITIYGNTSSNLGVSTNGYIMFGATPVQAYPVAIPATDYNGAGPVVHGLQGDLWLLDATANRAASYVSTGVIGSSPNQIFVVRFSRVTLFEQRGDASPPLFSWDFMFYQNSSRFETRYYRLDLATAGVPLSVGIQASTAARYVAVFSLVSTFSNIQSALLGNSLSFTPATIVPPVGASSSSAVPAAQSSSSAARSSSAAVSSSAAASSSSSAAPVVISPTSSSSLAALRSSSSSPAAVVGSVTSSSSSAVDAGFVTSDSTGPAGSVDSSSSSSASSDSNPPPTVVNGSSSFKPSLVLTVLASVIFFVFAMN